jgi:pimeloyl-ACP methyl ester carboxylesterase
MPVFVSYDGTEIGYRVLGDGRPLVCLPGGPGRAAEYLGDLGGVSASHQLVLLDPRGVGLSADPADPATLRVDLLVRDVDALRAHLGLNRIDLLAHSAGAVLATLYAAAHPQRLSRLILVTPGLAAVGVGPTGEQVRAVGPCVPGARNGRDRPAPRGRTEGILRRGTPRRAVGQGRPEGTYRARPAVRGTP